MAACINSQGNPRFPWRFIITAKELHSLGGFLPLPRKRNIPWRLNFSRQVKSWPPRQIQFGVVRRRKIGKCNYLDLLDATKASLSLGLSLDFACTFLVFFFNVRFLLYSIYIFLFVYFMLGERKSLNFTCIQSNISFKFYAI